MYLNATVMVDFAFLNLTFDAPDYRFHLVSSRCYVGHSSVTEIEYFLKLYCTSNLLLVWEGVGNELFVSYLSLRPDTSGLTFAHTEVRLLESGIPTKFEHV